MFKDNVISFPRREHQLVKFANVLSVPACFMWMLMIFPELRFRFALYALAKRAVNF